jgi:3-hydroxyisobutyrate dehydrogenase
MEATSMDSAPLRVGQIGIGALGVKIATRLVYQGHTNLNIYDIFDIPTRLFNHEIGGQTAGSPKMLGQVCDVVITVLPDAAEVRKAAFGWEGFARGLKPGGVLLELGQSDAAATRALAAELKELGIFMVDAPVMGTIADARQGRLDFMCGGEPEAIEIVRPILEKLGRSVTHIGPVGSAHAAALIADYLRASALLTAGEALRIADRYGIGVQGLVNLGTTLGGLGTAAIAALTQKAGPESMDQGIGLGLVRKDLDLALAIARASRLDTPLLRACRDAWLRAENDIGSGADHTDILRWIKQLTLPDPKLEAKPEPVKLA